MKRFILTAMVLLLALGCSDETREEKNNRRSADLFLLYWYFYKPEHFSRGVRSPDLSLTPNISYPVQFTSNNYYLYMNIKNMNPYTIYNLEVTKNSSTDVELWIDDAFYSSYLSPYSYHESLNPTTSAPTSVTYKLIRYSNQDLWKVELNDASASAALPVTVYLKVVP